MNTDNLKSAIQSIKQDVIDIVQLRLELLKVESVEYVAKLCSSIITTVIIGVICTMVLFFVSITLALYLSKVLDDVYIGFGIVSIGYTVLGIAIVIFRKTIITKPLINMFVHNLFNDEK